MIDKINTILQERRSKHAMSMPHLIPSHPVVHALRTQISSECYSICIPFPKKHRKDWIMILHETTKCNHNINRKITPEGRLQTSGHYLILFKIPLYPVSSWIFYLAPRIVCSPSHSNIPSGLSKIL